VASELTDLDSEIERALHDRKAKRRGEQYDFLCVNCEDGQNAAANWDRPKGVWGCAKCGAGGTSADLAKRLGIHVETVRERSEKERIVATYDYRDEAGGLRFQVVRMIPKSFRQRHPDSNGGWIWKGVETPSLYRLPELMASTGRVYIVEGEKDADAIRQRGGTATCNPGGASETGKSKWKVEVFGPYLKGRDVVILPDRDKTGDTHAGYIALSLVGVASSVRVLALPGLTWKAKKGPDVSDWFAGGAEFEELEELADNAAPWQPPATEGDEAPTAFNRSDAGNAELYAHRHGDDVRYDYQDKDFLMWRKHRWGRDPNGQMVRWAIEAARGRGRAAFDIPPGEEREAIQRWASASESSAKIAAMFELLQAIPPVAYAGGGWNANEMTLGVEGGVINLATSEFRDGRKDDMITKTTGIVYDPEAKAPRWRQFIEEIFEGDAEMVSFIQRAAGMSTTGSMRDQCWFLLHGVGANGKNTFVDQIALALGEYAATTPAATFTGNSKNVDSSAATPEMAVLEGVRFLTCDETNKKSTLDAGRMKYVTGGNPITARANYKDPRSFTATAKLWLSTNHTPNVDDTSPGFWRRVILIPFMAKFEGSTDDKKLKDYLREHELPGILRWLVEGAAMWQRDGLNPPDKVMVATWKYRTESDPLSEFVIQCLVESPDARTTSAVLYMRYQEWAKAEGIREHDRISTTMFGKEMGTRYAPARSRTGARAYIGVGIKIMNENASNDNPVSDTALTGLDAYDAFSGTDPRGNNDVSSRDAKNAVNASSASSPPCDCKADHPGPTACGGAAFVRRDEPGLHCPSCCTHRITE